jgi:hypothetical protein
MSDKQKVYDGIKLATAIGRLLEGKEAEVIDFALARLLANLLATYHPDVRTKMLAEHVLLTSQLTPTVDQEVYKHRQRPQDWPPATNLLDQMFRNLK